MANVISKPYIYIYMDNNIWSLLLQTIKYSLKTNSSHEISKRGKKLDYFKNLQFQLVSG